MGFIRVLKNKAYFKRYQVKYRRRREGKTDYYARRRLILQDKNKYDSPKYRFVVRITNSRIICQIISSTLVGDIVHAYADSTELVAYGIRHGLTNYAASYCTGLLLARRILSKLKLDTQFVGKEEADGEGFHIEEDGDADRRPFKALLDVGIRIVTTGNKVFGALKGACDGGLYIPHSEKRFPGYTCEGKEGTYDAKVHRERIFGLHVQRYMQELKEEDQDRYQKQFGKYIKLGVDPDKIEELYKACHEAIRKDPWKGTGDRKKAKLEHRREGQFVVVGGKRYRRSRKLSKEERRERVREKIALCVNQEAGAEVEVEAEE